MLWGLSHLWPLVRDCAAAAAAAVQPRCRHLSPLGHAAALAALSWTAFVLLPLAYLLTLQMYLLLTNQTTIEVTKGPRLRYLTPYYAGAHEGKSAYDLPAQLPKLLWDEVRGRGPPKPFSKGLVRNVWMLVGEACPRAHEPAPLPLAALAV